MDSLVERLKGPTYWKSSNGYTEQFDSAPFEATARITALEADNARLRHTLEAIVGMQALRYGDATRTHMALIGLCVSARQALADMEQADADQ